MSSGLVANREIPGPGGLRIGSHQRFEAAFVVQVSPRHGSPMDLRFQKFREHDGSTARYYRLSSTIKSNKSGR